MRAVPYLIALMTVLLLGCATTPKPAGEREWNPPPVEYEP